MTVSKKTLAAVICAVILAVFAFSTVSALGEEMEIYDKTLRLHILANSDGEADQALKLKVRDAVLKTLSKEINECESKEEAEALIRSRSNEIERTAEAVVRSEGYRYGVTLTVTEERYPKRSYGDITLPAGEYTSVRIMLGEAEGQNWWCVLFPQVCTDTATPADEKLAQVGFTATQIRLLTKAEKPEYKLRFKIVELISELFS